MKSIRNNLVQVLAASKQSTQHTRESSGGTMVQRLLANRLMMSTSSNLLITHLDMGNHLLAEKPA
jgi:hypothetical protein